MGDENKDENKENEKKNVVVIDDFNEQKEEKYKRKVLKSKPLMQNILNIIDKDKFILHQEQSQKENDKKIMYSVSLRNETNEVKEEKDKDSVVAVDLSENIYGNHFEELNEEKEQ